MLKKLKLFTFILLSTILLASSSFALNVVELTPQYIPNPTSSRALSNADIYVGIVDLDPEILANQKQISILQENGSTIEVAQPITTGAGGIPLYNGSPVTVMVGGSYSLKVVSSRGNYYVPSNAADTIGIVDTIADLRSYATPSNDQVMQVLGYYSIGDGGGGPKRVFRSGQPPGTFTDDGGSEILPDGGDGSGAWLWGTRSAATIGEFGVIAGDTPNNKIAMNLSITYASENKVELHGIPGVVILDSQVTLKSNLTLIGHPLGWFSKGYPSPSGLQDGMFRNENYAIDPIHDVNITLKNINLMNDQVTDTGTFLTINWVDGLTIDGLNMVKTSDSWCTHICAKNVYINNVIADSTAAPIFSDALHFEYLEDAIITNLDLKTQDDCIAFAYQPKSNASAGPNYFGRNITGSNWVLSSEIANGVRIGSGYLGDLTNSNDAHEKAVYQNMTLSNIVAGKLGASGTLIQLYDERSNGIFKHTDIKLNHLVLTDNVSPDKIIKIQGNFDFNDPGNINIKNFGRVEIDGVIMRQDSIGSVITGGGIVDLKLSNIVSNRNQIGGNDIDIRMVNNLKIYDSEINSNTNGNVIFVQDFLNFRIEDTVISGTGTETAGIRVNQVTLNGGTLDIIDCTMDNVQRSIQAGNNLATFILDEVIIDGLIERNIAFLEGVSPSLQTNKLIERTMNDTLTSRGGTGGAGSAGAGNQYIEMELDGVKYKVLHDGLTP